MKISAIIKAIRARINYVPNRTNFLTSFISKGGSPLTGEDIICSYIDALNELKKRAPHVRRYCFLRAMYFEKSEIDLINLDERSLAQFIKNLNVGDSDLSIKYKKKWSKEKNIKKVSRKVVAESVIYSRETNNSNGKTIKDIVDKYDIDIRNLCGRFYKKYATIDWGEYFSESMKKLIELSKQPLYIDRLNNKPYIMTAIKNHLVGLIRQEERHHKNTTSLDKLLEGLEQDNDSEE